MSQQSGPRIYPLGVLPLCGSPSHRREAGFPAASSHVLRQPTEDRRLLALQSIDDGEPVACAESAVSQHSTGHCGVCHLGAIRAA
jgi:hypothetical protein